MELMRVLLGDNWAEKGLTACSRLLQRDRISLYRYDEIYYEELGHTILKAEESQICHLQAGDPAAPRQKSDVSAHGSGRRS